MCVSLDNTYDVWRIRSVRTISSSASLFFSLHGYSKSGRCYFAVVHEAIISLVYTVRRDEYYALGDMS